MAPATSFIPKGGSTISQVSGWSNTFRNTKGAIDAGKILFGKGSLLISPQLATDLLRLAGVPVPKGVVVGCDVAQIIMAGGAFVTAAETASTISSYSIPVLAALSAVMDILSVTGAIDAKSPMAQGITLGIDVGLVVSSMGANVLADIKLGIDLTADILSANISGKLQAESSQTLSAFLTSRRTGQVGAAEKTFADYTSGKMSVFQLIGQVAEESPDIFLNYFPSLKQFVPTQLLTSCVTSSGSTLFGGSQSYTQCSSWRSIFYDKWNIQSAILQGYVDPWIKPFMALATQMDSPNIAIQTFPNGCPYINDNTLRANGQTDRSKFLALDKLAILSLMPPYFDILPDAGFDVRPYLLANFLTPADFGDTFISDEVNNSASKYFGSGPKPQAGITFNGVSSIAKPREINYYGEGPLTLTQRQNIINNDLKGNIAGLLDDPGARSAIYDWGNIPKLQSDTAGITRRIRNYWSAVSILQKVMTDPYMSSASGAMNSMYFSFLYENITPSLQYINDTHQRLTFISHARKANTFALFNIAKYLGTTPNNIVQLNKGAVGQPAVFGYKN